MRRRKRTDPRTRRLCRQRSLQRRNNFIAGMLEAEISSPSTPDPGES